MLLARIAAALALAAAAAAQAQPIVFGQSAPLTGANAELGNDIRAGALAYFRKANDAGGVHGHKLELVTLDDANQVPRSEANTRELVEQRRVFALFGYASATLSRPALPTVEKQGVPFLAPFTGADPMRVFNRHVYNMRASYAEELEKIVEHFVPLGVKRFSVVYYDDVVGRENYSAVERALKKRSLPIVHEYQAAIERQTGRKDFSFTSLESFIAAKAAVQALRRAGATPTRESFMRELDALKDFDAGGYTVSFSPTNHNGSSFVELTVIGKDLKFGY